MKVMRAVRVLAGLGLLGTMAFGSGFVAGQTAAPADPAKIGSSLIGKLEGPTIILDAKTFPKSFKEAPILAAQVKAGKLPAVDKRLPEPSELFVVKPLHEIGNLIGQTAELPHIEPSATGLGEQTGAEFDDNAMGRVIHERRKLRANSPVGSTNAGE